MLRGEDTGNCERKNYTAFCGELALEETTDLSYDRLLNE
jgi:hypothetical protein